MEQSILLLGQATISMTYHRRYNILSVLNCPSQQSKEMLREEADLLQQQDKNLLGKKFRGTLFRQPNQRNKPSNCFVTRVRKNRSPFDMARQRHRGGGLEGSKNSSSKRIVLVQRDNNKVSVDINKEAVAADKVKANKKETFFKISFPHLTPTSELENVHPLTRKLISAREVPKLILAGRLKHFEEAWKILTKDSEILELVEGYKVPFNKNPVQQKIPETTHTNLDQRHQVQVEKDNMLEKGAICQTSHLKEEFLSNVFLVEKKGRGNHPAINLKHLNQFIPYQHFRMEGLFCLREMLQKDDFMCKLDIKHIFQHHLCQKICQIFIVREPLRVPLPMFWLRPSTSDIYKTFKSPYISTEANKYLSDTLTICF